MVFYPPNNVVYGGISAHPVPDISPTTAEFIRDALSASKGDGF